MMQTHVRTVSEYIAAQPKAAQAALRRVRRAIRKALPRAQERISYNIPAYQLDGRMVLYFAGWKRHYSLYPASKTLVAAFKDQLAFSKVSKGAIRFPLREPVPAQLIERIAKFRAKELATRRKSELALRRNRLARAAKPLS